MDLFTALKSWSQLVTVGYSCKKRNIILEYIFSLKTFFDLVVIWSKEITLICCKVGRQAGNIDSIYARQIESMNHSRWDREERLVDTGTVPWQALCHLILIFMSQIVFTPPWHVKYLMQDRFFYRTCFFKFLALSANRLRIIVTVAK